MAATVADQTLLAWLAGGWSVARDINDGGGTFRGHAAFTPQPDGTLRWHETGELTLGDAPAPTYLTLSVDAGGQVRFDDGPPVSLPRAGRRRLRRPPPVRPGRLRGALRGRRRRHVRGDLARSRSRPRRHDRLAVRAQRRDGRRARLIAPGAAPHLWKSTAPGAAVCVTPRTLRSSLRRRDRTFGQFCSQERKRTVHASTFKGRRLICAGFAAVALLAAGCGSSKSDSGSSGSSTTAASTTASAGSSSSAMVADSQKAVDAAKQGLPAQYSGPTEAVKTPKNLTLAVMPCGGAVRGCVALTEAAADLGKQLGWTVKQYDGKSDPSNQNKAMLQAAAAGADIIITGGVAAEQIQSGIAAAHKKGIIVASTSQAETRKPNGYDFDINPAGPEMGKIAGQWMIADSKGKAVFQPWIDKEFGGAVQFLQGNIDAVKACSTCKVLDNQQFVAASLATDFGSRTVNVVRQNKDITYMNPSYDPAAAAQSAALMTAGLKDRVKIASINGNKQNLALVQQGQVQAIDVAYDQVYVGWMAVYQALRLYDKLPLYTTPGVTDPVHMYSGNVPYKLFDKTNVQTPIKEWVDDAIDWKAKLGKLMGLTNPR